MSIPAPSTIATTLTGPTSRHGIRVTRRTLPGHPADHLNAHIAAARLAGTRWVTGTGFPLTIATVSRRGTHSVTRYATATPSTIAGPFGTGAAA